MAVSAVHPPPFRLSQKLSDFLYVSTYLGYERRWSADALAALEAEFAKPALIA